MNTELMFSSKSEEWQTPQKLFDLLNEEFHFDLDAAATKENAKCAKYITKEMDALSLDWSKYGKRVYLNCPYGKKVKSFVIKAYQESLKGLLVVCLLPARTCTSWFFDYCIKGEIRFLKGRLKFINSSLPSYREDGNFEVSSAPFPSMIVIFGKDYPPKTEYVIL